MGKSANEVGVGLKEVQREAVEIYMLWQLLGLGNRAYQRMKPLGHRSTSVIHSAQRISCATMPFNK